MTDFDARHAPGAMIAEPGIYPDMSMRDYLSDPCPEPSASAGVLNTLIERSPAHAWQKHPRLGALPEPYRRGTALGTVFHSLLLGVMDDYEILDPEDYPAKNGNIPDGWTNPAIREARDAVMQAGKTPVLPSDLELAEAMVEAARAQLTRHAIGDIFSQPGKAEATMVWQEGELWCRARPDWLPEDRHAYYDIKTTSSAHPDAFQRRAFQHGYDFSAAHYQAGFEALFNEGVPTRFLVVETEPPHALTVVELNATATEYARRRRLAALKQWGVCLRSGQFPAYPREVVAIDMPGWMLFRQEERETSGQLSPEMLKHLMDFYRLESVQ